MYQALDESCPLGGAVSLVRQTWLSWVEVKCCRETQVLGIRYQLSAVGVMRNLGCTHHRPPISYLLAAPYTYPVTQICGEN